MKLLILWLTIILSIVGMLYFTKLSYENTIKYNATSKILVDKLNIIDNMKIKIDDVLSKLTFEYLGGEEKAKLNQLKKKREAYLWESQKYLLYYFLIILLCASLLFLTDKNLFSLFISIVALISLAIAIFMPILVLIVKTKDLLIIGELALQYEVKTIMGTITELLNVGNYVLAFVLVLVSILIPFLKSSMIFINALLRQFGTETELHSIIKAIGKWSMVDVLVVAILVVFFTTQEDMNSEMIIESGLYFFVIYVFISMISTYEVLSQKQTVNAPYKRKYYEEDFYDDYE